ncbi:MAG TPA: hypothetical protein VGO62_15435 [Myxococcota bacterium]|jgi:hypothetical protein
MITVSGLELQNRMRAAEPLVVLVTRRRAPASDAAVHALTQAGAALADDGAAVDIVGLDADDSDNATLLDDLRVRFIPAMFVCARGVILERTAPASADDAALLIRTALRRMRR